MKKTSVIFIAACMVLCLIPSVGMLLFPTTQTTENKTMAAPPSLMAEGKVNTDFFRDFEQYFNEHVALRNPMLFADAMIQTKVFQESNVSGVIDGTNGWLYYSSTLSDYLGTDVLTKRQLHAIANNLAVVDDYLQNKNIDFVFTIAPNKNTLYGEHMPYYKSLVANPDHSAKLLKDHLDARKVSYLDLFDLLEKQNEVLYQKQDSHWNTKGARLAYDAILDYLGKTHEDFAKTEPKVVKDRNGDLNKMLYSFYGPLEENYDYGLEETYTYTEGDDVEDGWIVTENGSGSETLVMFRDSFANTLIPFLSSQFKTAYYSKAAPNALEEYVETYEPDCVVMEKVERNISDYLDMPPLLTPAETTLPDKLTIAQTETTAALSEFEFDMRYWRLGGTVDEHRMTETAQILVTVDGRTCPAYLDGSNGYFLYLKKEALTADADVQVYLVSGDDCVQLLSETLTLP